ncbi:MAG: hypothetical protein FVQ80_00330 [Planctomycetes bacterium]|nr:hypothetical protein [Planctomycetota bacterium]MBW8042640.1 hypothetical protein [Planctomycetota bacterium]
MQDSLSKADVNRIIKSTIPTVITHLLLPLTFFPFAFFVVPSFAAKARELGVGVSKSTVLVFNLSSFICQYWYLCILILGFAVTIDAVICFFLFRLKRKIVTQLWSGFVILTEAVFASLCVLVLLLSLQRMSNAPWLCPV